MEALAGPTPQAQDGVYGSRGARVPSNSRAAATVDMEDRRVKELTEGILYDFLPAALNVMLPRCEDPLQELDADRCRAVASAALAVSSLMNAPPGFLEFLLCVPWRKLSQLYPKSDSIDKLVSNLQVTDDERRKLVNTRIDPALMGTLLDFLYKEKHADSVPPMLQLTPVHPLQPDDKIAPVVVRETVAAVLDGATPLHCAALRGNPAQVDHLLYCGADPTLRTAAGELAIELVPVCGDRCASASPSASASASSPGASGGGSGSGGGAAAGAGAAANGGGGGGGVGCLLRSCRCMGARDQEVWECRSRLARSLIARRCFFFVGVGLFAWLRLVVFCLLCVLGQAGCHTSINRPVVERHIDTRRQQKVAAARARAHALVSRMRGEAEAGRKHLAHAKRECVESAAFQRGPPDISQLCFTDPHKSAPPPPPPISQVHDINFHLQESGTSTTGEELPSEKAFKCFVRSVHALQSLDLHGDTVPYVFAEMVQQSGAAESRETHVLEDEQADLYSCWAESVLLKFRGCTCPGCAALAVQAVRMAHIQATRLFGKVDRVKVTHADRWRAVGEALARVVYVHICLLLETEAQSSPTRSLVWRAEQCLREWDRLEKAGLTQGAGVLDPRHVAALALWAKTADSDLYLAEALHGQPLPPAKSLQEVVAASVTYSPDGSPLLARPVSPDVVAALEQALTLSSLPSPLLGTIVRAVVANAAAELAAAARLRELAGAKGVALGGGGGSSEAVAALSEALRAAERFRARLGPELEAAAELRSKWMQRASAVEKLEAAVEDVRAYTAAWPLSFTQAGAAAQAAARGSRAAGGSGGSGSSSGGGGGGGGGGARGSEEAAGAAAAAAQAQAGSGGEGAAAPDLAEWDRRMKQLEAAMNDAKDANVSVTKAKRLHKEMAAVAAAAEASRALEAVMARRPSGPAHLKQALNRAEAAHAALAGLGGPPAPGLADVLGPLMAAARRRLDSERAAEALSKAAASYRTLADLARLEAAIYNAKKIGAEELDPESYRTSLELRATLQEAARARSGLETALRNLQNALRPEDAEALERALADAARWEELLGPDLAKARKALEQWRAMALCDAKLGRLLREGASTAVLARAIQEAAASGVKVQHAKRVLKLMQSLEAALGTATAAPPSANGGPGAPFTAAGVTAGSGGAAAAALSDASPAERHSLIKTRLEAAEAGGVTGGPLPEAARRAMARLAAAVAREALETALRPHGDWPLAQRITALREGLDRAEAMLGGGLGAEPAPPPPAAAAAGGAADSGGNSRSSSSGGGAHGGGGKRRSSGGGRGGSDGGAPAQQGQAPKLSNGTASGRSSRNKRSSGGGSVASGEGTGGGGEDAAAAAAAVAAPAAAPSGPDEEALAAVRELARRARRLLAEDQAEAARIERERQEAERARREAQERERQERQRQEQERQKREKAEAAERERLLAEKREKAKAEKARQAAAAQQAAQQQQQQQQQQLKGRTEAVSVAASAVSGGAVDKHAGGGGKAKNGGKAGGPTAATVVAVGARSGKAPPPQHPHAATAKGAATAAANKPAPHLHAPGQTAAAAPAAHAAPAPGPLAPAAPAAPPAAPAVQLTAAPALGMPPPALGASGAHVPAHAMGTLVAAPANHMRGDSLDSLGEVALALNRDVMDALDLDDLAAGTEPGAGGAPSAHFGMMQLPLLGGGGGGGGYGFGGNGFGGGAGGAASSTRASSFGRTGSGGAGDALTEVPSAGGGAAAAGAGAATATPPSGRTSSIMSSIASADDALLLQGGSGVSGAASLSAISTGQAGGGCGSGADAAAAALGGGGAAAAAEPGAGAGGALSAIAAAAAAATKPRFGFVDLGGASWGLESPLLSGPGATASLFPSLQASVVEFGSMLGTPKAQPDGAGAAAAAAAAGWSAGPLGAAVAAGMMFGGGGAGGGGGGPGPASGGGGAGDDGGGRQPGGAGALGGLGGNGGGMMGLGSLSVHTSDLGITGLGGPGVMGSPRTSTNLLSARPLGAGTASGLMSLGGLGGAAGGRQALQLASPPPMSAQQGAGGVARSGFWTPPAFQAAAAAAAADAAAAGDATGGGGGLQVLDWSQQGPGPTDGLQLLHLGQQGGLLRASNTNGVPGASRICRFYLQGYCRDGERCRFAHAGAPGGAGAGGAPMLQLPSPLAFGAPGAEAFAPLSGLSRAVNGADAAAGGAGAGDALQLGGKPGSHLRLGGGGGGGGGPLAGLNLLERRQLAAAAAAAQGQELLLGQQQQLQLRDGATGVTYSAMLTVAAPSPGGPGGAGGVSPLPSPALHHQQQLQQLQQQQQQLQLQHQHQLVLPDDLTFSPPSNPGTPASHLRK